MDAIAVSVLTMLLLVMLLVLVLTLAFRESLGLGMRASDFVYGVVVLAIWLLIWAGLNGWFSGFPPKGWQLRINMGVELFWLAVTSYTVVVLAFVVRKGFRAILAAYREGKRSADDPELLE
jgi:hypothetical protein